MIVGVQRNSAGRLLKSESEHTEKEDHAETEKYSQEEDKMS